MMDIPVSITKTPAAIVAGKRCPKCHCRDLAVSPLRVPPKVECLCCRTKSRPEELEDVPAKE